MLCMNVLIDTCLFYQFQLAILRWSSFHVFSSHFIFGVLSFVGEIFMYLCKTCGAMEAKNRKKNLKIKIKLPTIDEKIMDKKA